MKKNKDINNFTKKFLI